MTGPNEPTTSPRTDPLIWLRKVRERLTATSRSVDYHIAMLCVESTEAEYRQEREAAAATPSQVLCRGNCLMQHAHRYAAATPSLDSLRPFLRRAVEFAFEDAKQMRSYPAHPHLGLPFWPFEEFVDSLIEALKAEHPPVLARLDEGSATPEQDHNGQASPPWPCRLAIPHDGPCEPYPGSATPAEADND